jgi:hypothetical protein
MKKDLTWVQLVESFNERDCPLCFLVKRSADRYLDLLLHENLNDIGTREELRRSGGLCNAHAWQLTDFDIVKLGIAIVCQDLVGRAAGSFEKYNPSNASRESYRARAILRRDKSVCPACRISQESEERYTKAFVDSLDDEEFFKEYATSAGLCLPHFDIVLGKITDSAIAERLTRLEKDKLSSLGAQLEEFIRKQDYRFPASSYGPERDSWRRALEKLVGKRVGSLR